MKTKIAINGFGRIGRNAFKVAYERNDIEVVAVNDLTDTATLAHLLRHDSNYGAYQHKVESDEQNLIVEGQKIKVLAEKEPSELPWKDMGVDIVIESTGLFTDSEKARAHIEAGAKKVIISAPAKGESAQTIVIGVNEDKLAEAGDVISNASCTTNCIAPVAAILDSNFGIEKAMMTTVHSYTASQRLQDAPAKDLREARSAAINIVPTTTGASIAAAKALPSLEGIFGGLSVRVPTPVVSLSDFAVVTKKDVSIDEVNEAFKKAAQDPYYQGILDVTEEELVSTDYIGNSHSAIVDLKLTNVVGGNLVKVIAWYDNEWGYSNRLVEITADIAKQLSGNDSQKSDEAVELKKQDGKEQESVDDKNEDKREEPEEKSLEFPASKVAVTDLTEETLVPPAEDNKEPVVAKEESKPYTIIDSSPSTSSSPDSQFDNQPKENRGTEEDLLLSTSLDAPEVKLEATDKKPDHKSSHKNHDKKHKFMDIEKNDPESLEGPADHSDSPPGKFSHF